MNIHSVMTDLSRATSEEGRSLKREAILEAALELFSERGFDGTAVPLIAEKAGIGAGTVYRYFESKEAIVNALYQQYKRELADRTMRGLRPEQSAREQFHVYWTTMLAFVRENTKAFEFLELHHHSPYLDEASRKLEQKIHAMAHARFEEFRRQRVVKNIEPEILMSIAHGAFVGLVKSCGQQRLALSDEAMESAEQCVWEAIRG
jgi:AcrR family transcriptional regulator